MTELERQLTAALKTLSAQCEMEQGAAIRAGRSLAAASRAARRASDTLGRVLQDARREVERPLDLTRRLGRERDSGPTR